jgi:hypothetical protein
MGLDISAYSKAAGNYLGPAEQFSDEQREELYADDNVVRVYSANGFEARLDGYAEGFYRADPSGDSYGFRAGSYSGYNWWRRHLCRMAVEEEPEDVWGDAEEFEGSPFVELINFSDCEGAIGPRTSRKLADDFKKYAEQARAYVEAQQAANNPNRGAEGADEPANEWWLEAYGDWQRAFELAADDGFVWFR